MLYSSRNLHGTAVHALARRIVRGDYEQGGTLPIEDVLCVDLKISRGALREAVKVLIAKGFLSVSPRRGTKVLPRQKWHITDPDVLSWICSESPDLQFFLELTAFRAAVEPAAAAAAAKLATVDDLKRIDAAFKKLELSYLATPGAIAVADVVDTDLAFHQAILDASRNAFFTQVCSAISQALIDSREWTHRVEGAERRALAAHAAVNQAIQKRSSEKAHAAMKDLLDDVEQDLRAAFAK